MSSSGLKLQRMSRVYLIELSTHVTSELRSEFTLLRETETQKKGEEDCPWSFSQ